MTGNCDRRGILLADASLESHDGDAVNRSWLKPRANDLAALAVLLGLIALNHLDPALAATRSRRLGCDDFFICPATPFLGEHIRHFTVPGWNPHLFSGTPFAANPQSGWSYLPAMSIFALFSPLIAFRLLIAFEIALGGVTTFSVRANPQDRHVGEPCGGDCFFLRAKPGRLDLLLQPSATRCLDSARVDRESSLLHGQRTHATRTFWLAVSAAAISQIIAGWVGQGTYYALLLISAYLVFRAAQSMKPWRSRVIAIAINGFSAVLGGIALSAAGLAPRLEFAARTYVGTTAYQSEIIKPNKDWALVALAANVDQLSTAMASVLPGRSRAGLRGNRLHDVAPFAA